MSNGNNSEFSHIPDTVVSAKTPPPYEKKMVDITSIISTNERRWKGMNKKYSNAYSETLESEKFRNSLGPNHKEVMKRLVALYFQSILPCSKTMEAASSLMFFQKSINDLLEGIQMHVGDHDLNDLIARINAFSDANL